MLFLIWIRDLGYVPGGIFGTAPLVPQQQFFDILMIDSGFSATVSVFIVFSVLYWV